MKKFSQSHHSSMNELNITPLLDLAFVLLVIFIITTPQLVNNLELNLPSGKPPAQSGPRPKLNYVVVAPTGEIRLNDQAMTLPVLKQTLVQMKAQDPEVSMVVKGGADVDYQNIINVLDAIQQAEIAKVGLATVTQ
ncbi:MAG TPA: biopolymer transporter ExbD [Verrucomicrobiales bacterium]|nr:biopolymer transporter ExbD [Verrucomicrobiales bacterium]